MALYRNLPAPLPPILAGQFTPETQERVERFYFSVAAIFETWVKRRQSRHTWRAYREDVRAFVRFVGIKWPEQCASLLATSLVDVQAFREAMVAEGAAPKMLDARDETKALSLVRARQLMNMPSGESVMDSRDHAILKLYIYIFRHPPGHRLSSESGGFPP